MRVAIVFTIGVCLGFCALTPFGVAGPVEGVTAGFFDIPAEGLTVTKRFRGGERASVQVKGDHKSPTIVHITVHDAKNNLVAEDKGRELPVGDMASVIWYPPREAEYRVTVRVSEARKADYFIVIR